MTIGLGIDIGRTRDATVLILAERITGTAERESGVAQTSGRAGTDRAFPRDSQQSEAVPAAAKPAVPVFIRRVTVMEHTPFDEQEVAIRHAIRTYRPRKVCIDATGIGLQMSERLQREFGIARVEAFKFTEESKSELLGVAYDLFTSGLVRVHPKHRQIIEEFANIRKEVTQAGRIVYRDSPHGDLAWATSLALYAVRTAPTYGLLSKDVALRLDRAFRGRPEWRARDKRCARCGVLQVAGTPAMSGSALQGYICERCVR